MKNKCPWTLEELKKLLTEAGAIINDEGTYYEVKFQYGLGNVEKDNPTICWIFWAFWTALSSR